jgi:membrane protein
MNTFTKWQKHDATLRAAALTFFTIMPLPSLALLAVAILAQIYGQEQALQQLISQISAFAGPSVASIVSDILTNAQSPLTSAFGSLFSVLFAVAGAIGAFSVLQKSMDEIWEIRQPRGIRNAIKEKVIPFAVIIVLGTIVVAWEAFSTVLFGAAAYYLNPILNGFTSIFFGILQIIFSLGLGTLLFTIIFKLLPETEIQWRDVWLAAFTTGVVFTVLNYFFGIYLSLFPVTTLAGTGSLMVLFLWIYLTNLFILFGAQMSKVYSQKYGSYKNKLPTLKKPQVEEIDRIEMKAELKVNLISEKQKSVEK